MALRSCSASPLVVSDQRRNSGAGSFGVHVGSLPRCSGISYQSLYTTNNLIPSEKATATPRSQERFSCIRSCTSSTSSGNSQEDTSAKQKTPFGYTRKDVLLIGLGVTVIGVGLKSGLEFLGVDPLQAGNAVQLIIVLGLTVGWISTYVFRVANKDMTYAQQLRDYENKVMEKRLESLSEADIEALLEQVEEEKTQLAGDDQIK